MYLQTASLLVTAFLFGGMLLFSASFAAFLFKYLPPEDARMLIRKAFPPFYMFVIVSSAVALMLAWQSDAFNTASMAFILSTTLIARQVLMPAINKATDMGQKTRFQWLHGISVILTLGHIVLAAVILSRMVH